MSFFNSTESKKAFALEIAKYYVYLTVTILFVDLFFDTFVWKQVWEFKAHLVFVVPVILIIMRKKDIQRKIIRKEKMKNG